MLLGSFDFLFDSKISLIWMYDIEFYVLLEMSASMFFVFGDGCIKFHLCVHEILSHWLAAFFRFGFFIHEMRQHL